MVVSFMKEEISKFRVEVRSTLTEHFEYLKEVHGINEGQLKRNQQEHSFIVSEFKTIDRDFKKVILVREKVEAQQKAMILHQETLERI